MTDFASYAVNASRPGFDPYAHADVGWFGSKLAKSVSKTVKRATRIVSKVPGTSVITAPARVARDVARGRNVVRSVRSGVSSVVADTRRSLPVAAGVVSFVPGAGTVLGSGLNALSAVSQGQSVAQVLAAAAKGAIPGGPIAAAAANALQAGLSGQNAFGIIEAAARGALPQSIMAAVDFGRDAVRGRNMVKAALSAAGQAFVKGSAAEQGFNFATAVLTSGNPTAAALQAARNKLGTEEARRAFDAAVGTAATAAKSAASQVVSKVQPVRRATAPLRQTAGRVSATFRPVTARGAQVLASRVPQVLVSALGGRRDTAGLEDGGKTYVVENGDYAYKIAGKLTGNPNKWRELVAANPTKKRASDGNFATLFAGERLKVPTTWTVTAAPKVTADVLSQARAILKVWSESDGLNEAGVTDYGDRPEDSTLTWGPRDKLMLMAFVNWARAKLDPALPLSSDLTDKAADALRAWLAKHASSSPASAEQPPTSQPQAGSSATPEPSSSTSVGWPSTATSTTSDVVMSVDTVTPSTVPAAIADTVPADILAMASAAQASGNVSTMRQVANAIRSKGGKSIPPSWTELANKLDTSADKLEAQQFGVADPYVAPEMVVTGSPPAKAATTSEGGGDGMGLLLVGGLALAKLANLF